MAENLFRYRVTIPYCEPTFVLHRGLPPEKVYYAEFNVVAKNETEAIERGLEIFKINARNSSVGWCREPEIKDIKVEKNKIFKILVVDDELALRKSLEIILKGEGYDVATAHGGEETIKMLRSHSFDLVTTCINMPGMNGLQLLKMIKKIFPDMPVIIITAYGTLATARSAIRFGTFDYLMKPFDTEELISAVRRALSKNNGNKTK